MAFNIGDSFSGGTIFHIENNIAYIASAEIILSTKLLFRSPSDTASTLDSVGEGKDNTDLLLSFAGDGRDDNAVNIVSNKEWATYTDWHIPSIDELSQIYLKLSHIFFQGEGFINSHFYYSSSINVNGQAKRINGNNGDVSAIVPLASVNHSVIYIRQQPTDGGGITISDTDITTFTVNEVIDFTHEETISVSNNNHEEIIPYRTNSQFSTYICSIMDMSKLGPGFEATPQSLFGHLPNILSVHTYDGKSWYNDGGLANANLTAIETGKVYQLVFSQPSQGQIRIVGQKITYPFNFTIPQGASWFPYLGRDVITISGGREAFFSPVQIVDINEIQNLNTGAFFPRLDEFEPNLGYAIDTDRDINVIFKL